MQRPQGVGVSAIQRPPPVAAHGHEADGQQDLQVLGDGWLPHLQFVSDVANCAFLSGEVFEDVTPSRLGDGVENVGMRGSARHATNYIFLYRNMSTQRCPTSEATHQEHDLNAVVLITTCGHYVRRRLPWPLAVLANCTLWRPRPYSVCGTTVALVMVRERG